MDPINYSGMLTQIDLRPLQQGFAQRRENQIQDQQVEARKQQVQLAQAKFEYDQQKDTDYLTAVQTYQQNPTPEALRDLGMRFPEQAERLQKAGDSYTAAQKSDMVNAGFSTLGAIASNNVPLAISTLQRRRDGLANSGVDTTQTDAAIQLLKDGKTKEATAYLSYAMGGLVGADHAAGVLETLGVGGKADDRRADNARADRALNIRDRQVDSSIARGEAASARAERAADRADRKAAGGGSSGGSSGGYEYRIGPDGKLQRRKKS